MKNQTYENYTLDIRSFKTSTEFSNHLYDFVSKYAYSKSISYPNMIHIDLSNGIHNVSFLFIYPYIDKNISYEIFFEKGIISNTNKLFVRISYTR